MLKKFIGLIFVLAIALLVRTNTANAALTLDTNSLTSDGVLALQGTSLAITGNAAFNGTIALGGTAVNANRYIILNVTNNTNTAIYGASIAVTRTDPSIGFNLTGAEGDALYNSASFSSTNQIAGTIGFGRAAGGGGASNVNGGIFNAWNLDNGAGVITKLDAVNASIGLVNSGTTTSARGVDISGWFKTGSSVATNSYGIYMDTSIDVGATRYALYSSATSQSYLQGNLGIGIAVPTAKLEVKDGHIASSQTTAPTASVTGSGYSGGSMGSGSSDTKGSISATVGAAAGTLVVTFNSAYASAPVCSATPATATAQVDSGKMYATTTTGALTLNFVATPTGGSETWSYICVQ